MAIDTPVAPSVQDDTDYLDDWEAGEIAVELDDKDPQVELDIPTTARDLPSGDIAALNNSFGFGGANVAVAFGSR